MKSPALTLVDLFRATCVLTVLSILAGCTKETKDQEVFMPPVQSFCDEVSIAHVEYTAYLRAAVSELSLAGEPDAPRDELCKTMKASLHALQAYSLGYNRGLYQSRSMAIESVRVYSETLLPNIVDIGVACRTGKPEQALALLARIENEIKADVAQQMAICKAKGYKSARDKTP